MKARLLASLGAALAVALIPVPSGFAQTPTPTPTPTPASSPPAPPAAPTFATGEIDQLVAPVALYPDPLLSQILMAATYPLEVVEADRWRQEPANTTLSGDGLTAALDQQTWDPSVKSLVPYPQILTMMDGDLEWTESLGEAFIADPSAVMDEIQKLRHEAQANGKLASNAEETITDQQGDIGIQPADPSTVYVPDYNPDLAYGPWPYPDYPPYYFPDFFDDCEMGDFGYCWISWPIFVPLWGWDHWDWRNHHIDIDRDRFTRLDHGHAPPDGGIWAHDPSHRHGVPYRNAGLSARFPSVSGPAGGQRSFRGYPAGTAEAGRPSAGIDGPPSPSRESPEPRTSPSFESYGRGAGARIDAARGQASRMTPSYAPRGGGFPGGGFHGGGFHGGGFRGGGFSGGGFHGGGRGRR